MANYMDLSFIVFSCSFALGFLIEDEELSAGPSGNSNYAKVFGIGLMSRRLRLHNRARASTKCDMETQPIWRLSVNTTDCTHSSARILFLLCSLGE
jgi:hypothetical protein